MRILLAFLAIALPAAAAEPTEREPVPAGALQRLGTTRFRADGSFQRVFYSRDDRQLIVCARRSITLVDAASGLRTAMVTIVPERAENGRADERIDFLYFDYDPIGHRIACHGGDAKRAILQCWDLATGTKTFETQQAGMERGVQWMPGGRILQYSESSRDHVYTVCVRGGAGESLHSWTCPGANGGGVDFLPIDRRRIARIDGSRIALLELETGRELSVHAAESRFQTGSEPAVSADGKYIAIGGDNRCEVYETDSGERIAAIPGDFKSGDSAGLVERLTFSPDAKTLYYRTETARAYDIPTGKALFDIRLDNAFAGRVAAISHDGTRIACQTHRNPVIHQVNAKTGREIAAPPGHEPHARPVWMPDGKRLLARSPNESCWSLWNLESGRRERLFEATDTKAYSYSGQAPVSVSADGRQFTDFGRSGRADNSATVFDVASGRVAKKLFPAGHVVNSEYRKSCDGSGGRLLTWNFDRASGRSDLKHFSWWDIAADKKVGGFTLQYYDADFDAVAGRFIAVLPFVKGNEEEYGPDNPNPYRYAVRLHRDSDGKLFRLLDHAPQHPDGITASANGELMLTGCGKTGVRASLPTTRGSGKWPPAARSPAGKIRRGTKPSSAPTAASPSVRRARKSSQSTNPA